MKRNRVTRTLVGLVVAGALAGVTAPAGVAQDYGEVPIIPGTGTGTTSGGGGAAGGSGTSQQYLLRQCIVKAKAKFGDNKVKRKKAIKKCRKKYGS